MTHPRALYQMVRADFLERTRRYSFLVTLGISVYLGYAVYAGQVVIQLGQYRGVNNSAWLGSVIGLVASCFLSLIGFYVVKNSIQRDRETRVGQILATTPMSKTFYTLSKTISNFAVLAAMLVILSLAALAIQLSHAEDTRIDVFALLAPILVFGFSSIAVAAALAVLFESIPALGGGVGNIAYFFLWTTLVTLGVIAVAGRHSLTALQYFADYTGIATVLGQMRELVLSLDPNYGGSASFNIGGMNPATKIFLWTGIRWNAAIFLGRALWLVFAGGLAVLAALFFDRFDPARSRMQDKQASRKRKKAESPATTPDAAAVSSALPRLSVSQLTPLLRTKSHSRFAALVIAELRLMLQGQKWWWYAVAAGLFIGCLASPTEVGRTGIIGAAWIWPALLWSQMGTREARFSTGSLIFSAQRVFPRQLLAAWTAGVVVAVATGGGLAVRLLLVRDFAGLAAWMAGALFIPSLALALGVCTESRKPFEAFYTAWWYIGPMHHIPAADFMGTTAASSTPAMYLAASAVLLIAALSWRKARLAHA
jgi:hypothetical protein